MSGEIKRAYYDAPCGQILYRYIITSATEKKAPVVFLHQSPSCGYCYETMMKEYAERGHDCYAPDMPGFGGSDDVADDPTSTRFYVDTVMGLFRYLNMPKMHLVGHHTGSALAMEMAAIYPNEIFTICCSAPAIMTNEEQVVFYGHIAGEWSKPRDDGTQFTATWDMLKDYVYGDLDTKVHETLDALRSWKARKQAYGVLSKQDKITYFKNVTCPVLAVCSENDVLYPFFHYCQELQPRARCEITTSNAIFGGKTVKDSIGYFHMDFLDKMGA